jgi:TP901 family phage tail tape measure protein
MISPSGIRAGAAYIELFVSDRLATDLATAERRLRSFAAGVNNMGRTLVATGIALGMPVAFSLKTFAEFEAAMSSVRAVSGATEEDMVRLTDKARELGRSTSFGAIEVAKAMDQLAKAGFTADDMLTSIKAILDMARAGDVGLDYAANVAANIANAFELTGNQITRVVDNLAQAANASSVNIDHMAETYKYLAPWAKAADQSIESMSIALAALGNVGIRASTAGTDLALVFKRLADPRVRRELERKLDIKVTDLETGKLKPFITLVKEISEASRGLSQVERMNIFAEVFDRAAKSMLNLALAPDLLARMEKEMADLEGAASRMADIMDDNLLGAWRRFMNALQDTRISFGGALKEIAKEWLT